MASRVGQDDAAQAAGVFHQAFDRDRLAPVEIQARGVGVQPFLISVQFVGGDRAQPVDDHAVAIDRIGQRAQRGIDPVGRDAHQRQRRPLLHKVGIVGQAAAEIAIGHLALGDPPFHEAVRQRQILQLAKGPGGGVGGYRGQRDGRQVLRPVIDVRPIGAGAGMVGGDTQQIADVGIKTAIKAGALRGGMLLDQKRPIVLHLVEAVGDMFGQRLLAWLEDQADAGAVDARRAKREIGGGKGQRQALRGQDAVAQVEP